MVIIKRMLRYMVLVFVICLACLAPIPLIFRRNDTSNHIVIAQLDKEEEEDLDELKELF